jgi:pyruvate/2-oxoglutarate dehydrogenase complex dihydrolipoamide acyltransferase (E2) component
VSAGAPAPPDATRTPLSPFQQMTIENLRRGQAGKVPVTIYAEARADALLAARARLAEQGTRASVTVLLARVLAATLADHPALNVTLEDEALVQHADVNLALAVATDDGGLMVPVIARAQERSVAELAELIGELAERARRRKLRLDDVRGGTFTLSSTGTVGLPAFATPLMSPGQSGVLMVAAAGERVLVADGAPVVGRVFPLSLTFDHAAVNGIPALRFLEDLAGRLERPDALL